MGCLSQDGLKLGLNVNVKEELTHVAVGFVVTALIHYILENYVFKPLAAYLLTPTKSKTTTKKRGKLSDEDLRQLDALKHKFCTSAWKFVSYAFFVGYGVYALSGSDWLWKPKEYHYCFLNNEIPTLLRRYYTMAIAYYAYSSISIFFEPKMKDRNEMLVHHAVTLTLLISSYVGNVVKYGLAILILHDLADPWMELAKLCFYSQVKWLSNVFFCVFASSFIYLRVYIYPRYIVWVAITHQYRDEYAFYWPTVICLSTLWLLHVFWSFLILRVLNESVLGDGKKGDVREEED